MVVVAQLVRALVCGTRGRGFKSRLPPHPSLFVPKSFGRQAKVRPQNKTRILRTFSQKAKGAPRSSQSVVGSCSNLKKLPSMHYVYRIRSLRYPDREYTGSTSDLRSRLRQHNDGCCDYTRPFKPWKVVWYGAYEEAQRARDFERYLKTGSGSAFAKKRL